MVIIPELDLPSLEMVDGCSANPCLSAGFNRVSPVEFLDPFPGLPVLASNEGEYHRE